MLNQTDNLYNASAINLWRDLVSFRMSTTVKHSIIYNVQYTAGFRFIGFLIEKAYLINQREPLNFIPCFIQVGGLRELK